MSKFKLIILSRSNELAGLLYIFRKVQISSFQPNSYPPVTLDMIQKIDKGPE
jgi:hypothetical protein